MSNHHQVVDTHLNGGSQKTIARYLTGYILSVILTVAAFLIVEKQWLAGEMAFAALAALAVVQFIVQVICFLRLNTQTEDDRWNFIAFLFTLLIIAIVITGSLWIMYNLNYYMVH